VVTTTPPPTTIGVAPPPRPPITTLPVTGKNTGRMLVLVMAFFMIGYPMKRLAAMANG
jgi:hypothetical protein